MLERLAGATVGEPSWRKQSFIRTSLRRAAVSNASRGAADVHESQRTRGGFARAVLPDYAPTEILVAHDELDLKPGVVKLKQGGGIAGHNGLKDIAAALGTGDFWRLRVGIGHPRDGALSEQEVADYVLHPPPREERLLIDDAIVRALAIWPWLARGDTERAMHELHTAPRLPPASEGSASS